MTAITTHIKKISTAVPPLSWPRAVSGMQHHRRGPDGHAHRADAQHDRAEPDPARHRLTAHARSPGSRRHLTEQPGVYPLVDFFADPLDEAFGYGGVVGRAEIAMRGRRGADFILDAHAVSPASAPRRRGAPPAGS